MAMGGLGASGAVAAGGSGGEAARGAGAGAARRSATRIVALRVRGVHARPRGFPGGRGRGGGTGSGVQQHELRRLPQRAGHRRYRADDHHARRHPRTRRDVSGHRAGPRLAVPDLLHSDARLPVGHSARGERHRQAGSHPAVRRRPDRGDTGRGARGARRSRRFRPRRRQRASPAGRRAADGGAARRSLRMEVAACDAARLRGRRLPQRDGDNERPVPRRACLPAVGAAARALRRDAGPRGRGRAVHRPARHRQLRVVHAAAGAAAARAGHTRGDDWQPGVRRHRLRGVPRAGARDRTEHQSGAFPISRSSV